MNLFEGECVWCCGKNKNVHKPVMRRKQHFAEGRRKKKKIPPYYYHTYCMELSFQKLFKFSECIFSETAISSCYL